MDALKAARVRLEKRIAGVQVAMVPGLRDDLGAIVEALEEIERRLSTLAASVLRSDFGVSKHPAQLEALARMGADPATVLRVFQHGPRCTCADCMRNR